MSKHKRVTIELSETQFSQLHKLLKKVEKECAKGRRGLLLGQVSTYATHDGDDRRVHFVFIPHERAVEIIKAQSPENYTKNVEMGFIDDPAEAVHKMRDAEYRRKND